MGFFFEILLLNTITFFKLPASVILKAKEDALATVLEKPSYFRKILYRVFKVYIVFFWSKPSKLKFNIAPIFFFHSLMQNLILHRSIFPIPISNIFSVIEIK